MQLHVAKGLLAAAAAIGLIGSTYAIPYSEYVLAPESRTVYPESVYKVNGTVTGAETLTGGTGSATFQNGSVTFDYGKNIAGIVSLKIASISGTSQDIGLTFTESSLWISGHGSDATADSGIDETIWLTITGAGTYTVDEAHQRGGFRYLSLIHNTTDEVEVTDVTTYFTAMPHVNDNSLRNYTGYFHSSSEKLNRVWYAGAYTNQLCSIDPTRGYSLVHQDISSSDHYDTVTWWLNTTIANGTVALTDGAKRDRLVWSGDIMVSGPSIFVSTYDLDSIRYALDSLLVLQNENGTFPYAGYPFNERVPSSFTYHLHTLVDIYNYYIYSSNLTWMEENWSSYKRGIAWALELVDSTGLANITYSADWLRSGMGGYNIEANSILYNALKISIELANLMNDTSLIANWTEIAKGVKEAANDLLWSSSDSLFTDNQTTTLCPQDGNAWAVYSNLTSSSRSQNVSDALRARWGTYGPPAPEAGDTVSPFVSSIELSAHILAGNAQNAIDLIETMWYDFMLSDPRMTNSTFIEGYSTNGSLHYSPYTNDPRVSHAHGWATGPTSVLTMSIAGIQLTAPGGKKWSMLPAVGNLTSVEAGFSTNLGWFEAKYTAGSNGAFTYEFEAPKDTMGLLAIERPTCNGNLELHCGGDGLMTPVMARKSAGERFEIDGLRGGKWRATFNCV